jgi:hypothetical protein
MNMYSDYLFVASECRQYILKFDFEDKGKKNKE